MAHSEQFYNKTELKLEQTNLNLTLSYTSSLKQREFKKFEIGTM